MRIAIISPILALRAGLRSLLSASPAFPDAGEALQVVSEAASLADFEAASAPIDVLVVTAEAAPSALLRRSLASAEGRLALLLLSDDPRAAQSLPRLPLRAWGVLPLDSSAEELQAAVRALHHGLLVGAPSLVQPVFARMLADETEQADALAEPLTEREGQVLGLLARGLANKQIALELGISEHTVKFHISSIYAKLGVTSRTEAVRAGVQRGLVVL